MLPTGSGLPALWAGLRATPALRPSARLLHAPTPWPEALAPAPQYPAAP